MSSKFNSIDVYNKAKSGESHSGSYLVDTPYGTRNLNQRYANTGYATGIDSITIYDGGSNYAVGDVVTIDGGITSAYIKITKVNSGIVEDYDFHEDPNIHGMTEGLNRGSGYNPTVAPVDTTAVTGNGIGLQVLINSLNESVDISPNSENIYLARNNQYVSGDYLTTADNLVGVIPDSVHGNKTNESLHAVATPTSAGFMSAQDKENLDSMTTDDPAVRESRIITAGNGLQFSEGNLPDPLNPKEVDLSSDIKIDVISGRGLISELTNVKIDDSIVMSVDMDSSLKDNVNIIFNSESGSSSGTGTITGIPDIEVSDPDGSQVANKNYVDLLRNYLGGEGLTLGLSSLNLDLASATPLVIDTNQQLDFKINNVPDGTEVLFNNTILIDQDGTLGKVTRDNFFRGITGDGLNDLSGSDVKISIKINPNKGLSVDSDGLKIDYNNLGTGTYNTSHKIMMYDGDQDEIYSVNAGEIIALTGAPGYGLVGGRTVGTNTYIDVRPEPQGGLAINDQSAIGGVLMHSDNMITINALDGESYITVFESSQPDRPKKITKNDFLGSLSSVLKLRGTWTPDATNPPSVGTVVGDNENDELFSGIPPITSQGDRTPDGYLYICSATGDVDLAGTGTPQSYFSGDQIIWITIYDETADLWNDTSNYVIGDKRNISDITYECIQDHDSSVIDTKPGEGVDWRSYWKINGQWNVIAASGTGIQEFVAANGTKRYGPSLVATAGDYTDAMITNTSPVSGATVFDALSNVVSLIGDQEIDGIKHFLRHIETPSTATQNDHVLNLKTGNNLYIAKNGGTAFGRLVLRDGANMFETNGTNGIPLRLYRNSGTNSVGMGFVISGGGPTRYFGMDNNGDLKFHTTTSLDAGFTVLHTGNSNNINSDWNASKLTTRAIELNDSDTNTYNKLDISYIEPISGFNGTLQLKPLTVPGSGTSEFITVFANNTSTGSTKHSVLIQGKLSTEDIVYLKSRMVIRSSATDLGGHPQIWHDGRGTVNDVLTMRAMRESTSSTIVWEKYRNGEIQYSTGSTPGGTNTIVINPVSGGLVSKRFTIASSVNGYFYSDAVGRTTFTDGDFLITESAPITRIYSPDIRLGPSGSAGNISVNTGTAIRGPGYTIETSKLTMSSTIGSTRRAELNSASLDFSDSSSSNASGVRYISRNDGSIISGFGTRWDGLNDTITIAFAVGAGASWYDGNLFRVSTTGDIINSGTTITKRVRLLEPRIETDQPYVGFFTTTGLAKSGCMGSLTVSNDYSNTSNTPANGIYSLGDIRTSNHVYTNNASAYYGSWGHAKQGFIDIQSTSSTWAYNVWSLNGGAGARMQVLGGSNASGAAARLILNNDKYYNFLTNYLETPGHLALGSGHIESPGALNGNYGSISINGARSGYAGVHFTAAGRTFMVGTSAQGIHTGSSWQWYFNNGVLTEGYVPYSRVTGAPTTMTPTAHTHSGHDVRVLGNRLTVNADGSITVNNESYRQAGMYGIYNASKIGHIWSMGSAYKITANGSNFGNMYGFAYKYVSNTTGGTMADGHQAVWCQNGTPYCALGNNIWTSGNITAYSDIRVKTDIKIIDNPIERVKQLNGYTFNRTDIEDIPRQTGVIAQEVLKVLPEAVTGGPTENDPDNHYSVAYGNMVGLLIEVDKAQQETIEELQNENRELKDKYSILEE